MPRPLRFLPPYTTTETTIRTLQGRYLLPLTPAFATSLVGIIARAKEQSKTYRYGEIHEPIKVHLFTQMSNHMHFLLTPRDTEQLSRFMQFVSSNIATEASRVHGWTGTLWEDRFNSIPLTGEDGVDIERFGYIVSHGVKEGLVGRCADWIGLHCADSLTTGQPLKGQWVSYTQLSKANRCRNPERAAALRKEAYVDYELELDPLPSWQDLPKQEMCRRAGEVMTRIEEEAAARRTKPLPDTRRLRRIQERNPHYRPTRVKKSIAPICHAASRQARIAWREAYRAFVAAFRWAAEQLRRGRLDAEFPAWSFPPGRPFVQTPVTLGRRPL